MIYFLDAPRGLQSFWDFEVLDASEGFDARLGARAAVPQTSPWPASGRCSAKYSLSLGSFRVIRGPNRTTNIMLRYIRGIYALPTVCGGSTYIVVVESGIYGFYFSQVRYMPRGPTYSLFQDPGSENHTRHGLLSQSPQIGCVWTF